MRIGKQMLEELIKRNINNIVNKLVNLIYYHREKQQAIIGIAVAKMRGGYTMLDLF